MVLPIWCCYPFAIRTRICVPYSRISTRFRAPGRFLRNGPPTPGNRKPRKKSVREFLGRHADRVLYPVYAVSASKLMLQKNIPAALPTPLANTCRALAYQALGLLEVSCEEPVEEPEEVAEPKPAVQDTAHMSQDMAQPATRH